MIITISEIIDATVMVLGVGFIFHSFFAQYKHVPDDYDPLTETPGRFDWKGYWFTIMVTAPALVAHELFHKIAGLAFGLQAVFHAAYTWLFIGIMLKLMGIPFFFIVPGYVEIRGYPSPLESTLVAFAGPALNLFLWLLAWSLLHFKILKKRKYIPLLVLTSKINMFLFIFNMLPISIPFLGLSFDGYQVFGGLLKTIFPGFDFPYF